MLPVDAGDNFDLRLHDDYTGSLSGFGTIEANSASPAGKSDFVLANGNNVGASTIHWAAAVQGTDTPDGGDMVDDLVVGDESDLYHARSVGTGLAPGR